MTKRLQQTLFSLLAIFFSLSLSAEIIETMKMEEIYQHLSPEMLVIFDIDNTLIEPVQELGSNQWFEHRIREYVSYGYEKQDALEKALKEWSAIQNITQVKLVEKGSEAIVKDLQDQGFTVIGLTTRGLGLSTLTIQQLERVGVDLTITAPTKKEVFFMNGQGVLFRGGALFTAGSHKGTALKKFLKKIHYKPSSILFINDKYSHLVPVEEFCEKEEISFVGLRYGYLDKKVRNLRKQISEVQFYHFGHILSDDAAERILHER